MANINVVYWNLENFGANNPYKGDYLALCDFMARVVAQSEADILCIQEIKAAAIGGCLETLHRALCALPAPRNNWYFDVIKGSVRNIGMPPYANNDQLDWDAAHHEGYAIFWNQNIAKFVMQIAAPVSYPGAAPQPNNQSQGVSSRALNGTAFIYDSPVLANITIPLGAQYNIPANTTSPVPLPHTVAPGFVIPATATIGAGGVTLNTAVLGFNPVLIPEGFTLTDPVTLPAIGDTIVPQHILGLVLLGRPLDPRYADTAQPFVPGAAHQWAALPFTRSASTSSSFFNNRRPASCTIKVNSATLPNTAAERLIPITTYHAPSSSYASTRGMYFASLSRELYQAYDHTTSTWVDVTRSVLGGDNNMALSLESWPYYAYTNDFADGGAQCDILARDATAVNNNSIVQLTDHYPFGGNEILSGNPNDYRRRAIDNVFYAGFTEAQAPINPNVIVIDLVSALLANMQGLLLQQFLFSSIYLATQINILFNRFIGPLPNPPLPIPPNMNSLILFIQNLYFGTFQYPVPAPGEAPPARRGVEFIKFCVSDHLPLLFRAVL